MKNNSELNLPKVSIGMPVYNGEKTIGNAIESLLLQSFNDYELTVSDNASTDSTPEICMQFAEADNRIKYIRQPFNIGAMRNFAFVLKASKGNYFMWAAADDCWGRNFLRDNVSFLDNNYDYIGSISKVDTDGKPPVEQDYMSLFSCDRFLDRVYSIVGRHGSNCVFYSLFRRQPLDDLFNCNRDFLAHDWLTTILLLQKGKLNVFNNEIGFFKPSSLQHNKNLFPYVNYSFRVIKIVPNVTLVGRLLGLNAKTFCARTIRHIRSLWRMEQNDE